VRYIHPHTLLPFERAVNIKVGVEFEVRIIGCHVVPGHVAAIGGRRNPDNSIVRQKARLVVKYDIIAGKRVRRFRLLRLTK
jgi:hypothetical protein